MVEYVTTTTAKHHMVWLAFFGERYKAEGQRVGGDYPGYARRSRPVHDRVTDTLIDDSTGNTSDTPSAAAHGERTMLASYNGKMYELGASKPRLMDINDDYDELELAMTKAVWMKRVGQKA